MYPEKMCSVLETYLQYANWGELVYPCVVSVVVPLKKTNHGYIA